MGFDHIYIYIYTSDTGIVPRGSSEYIHMDIFRTTSRNYITCSPVRNSGGHIIA